MLAAMSGRLLSGGRAIGLALLAGLTVAAVGTGLRYTALDGTTVLLIIDATLYGLLAGCVGGLARGNARAALAAAITGAVFALCLHFVPRDLYISLGEAIGAPASSALRRAIWWTAVLAAEAWALRKDHA
jgi:hypothetical protein